MDFNTSSFLWIQDFDAAACTEPVVVYFRKEFEGASDLWISANCRYKLYINGSFVQEGPQKGSRETAYKDKVRKEAMSEGRNTMAVEVLYYPEDSSKRNDSLYYSPYPCLYIENAEPYAAETRTEAESEPKGETLTDAENELRKETLTDAESGQKEETGCKGDALPAAAGWKYAVAEGVRLVGEPFLPAPIHGAEVVQGEARFHGWKEEGYDDSSWKEAKPYTFFEVQKPTAPFHLKERFIPPMEHRKAGFQGVVCVRESSAQTAESLTIQWNDLLCGKASVEISANTTQIVEISAGEEMCGYPSLSLVGGKDARIEILYAECYGKPQPDMETPAGKRPMPPLKGDRTDYRNGSLSGTSDIYVPSGCGTRENPEIYTPYLFRTFRYIQLKIHTMDQGMSILGYDYITTGYPLEVKTRLKTSDETLNKIWDISLRSLQRCMHETYVDCPYYEQLQYTMDSRAEILFTYSVSGDDRLARQCMEAFRQTQRSDGMLQASAPAQGVNVIPGFSIFYILMLYDHMMYFGDKVLLRDHFGCMDRVLEYFRNHLTEKGLVGDVGGILFRHPYWSFIDWCPEWDKTIGVPEAKLYGDHSLTMESLLYLQGLKAAEKIAQFIGRYGTASEYRRRAERLEVSLKKYCTGKDGLLKDGPEAELYSTHCQVWGILTDVLDREEGRRCLEKTLFAKDIPQCSVSMSFYLFEALRKLEWMEKAEEVWQLWQKMLENNMTTCVENFTDQRSDCHAWGAVILYVLPALYLGIRPASPGFGSWKTGLRLGHLSWIEGEVFLPGRILPIKAGKKSTR